MSENGSPLLKVVDLKTYFDTDDGVVKAVDGISYRIERAQTFALVGESGCGKSVSAMSVMRLIPTPPGRMVGGQAFLNGRDLLALPEPEMRRIRGKDIAMVFQEPMTSLNPVYTVGAQIVEAIELHQKIHGRAAWELAEKMLWRVGIPEPAQRVREYPHQLSGGMRQRVMVAMALSCNPQLVIADEPTTALDVTIQGQILDLLKDLQDTAGLSVLLITHDLGVVAETADVVGVMYAGLLAELADVRQLLRGRCTRTRWACSVHCPRWASYGGGWIRSKGRRPIWLSGPRAARSTRAARWARTCRAARRRFRRYWRWRAATGRPAGNALATKKASAPAPPM